MATDALIHVVDDDDDMRDSLVWLIESAGYPALGYDSAEVFLQAFRDDRPSCLVLDVRMPGMSGLELYERVRAHAPRTPAIFVTAHADVPTALRAFRSGAFEFLEKPFERQQLIERVARAVETDTRRRQHEEQWAVIQSKITQLSVKEREVLSLLMRGASNKVIAMELDITERAVEMRRASLMKKLQVASLAEVVQLATRFEMGRELHESLSTESVVID